MGYVIYDLETTGLRKGFDQILQFAAVLTDEELQIRGRYETRCRLIPYVVPAPGALDVTRTDIRDILRPDLPSHFEMVCGIHERLRAWGPSIYLGFNSIRFDEEFLRQAFYQSLLPVYLTNTGGSARADVLNLARVAASLRPETLKPHRDADGRTVFRLADLARANGIDAPQAHLAAADVDVTLALCRRLRDGAPDLWSRFVQFSQKSVADAFIRDEDAFLMFQAFGDHCRERVLTRIGEHTDQKNRQYCLDLATDMDDLEALSDDALAERLGLRDGPLVILKTNAAPLLCPVYDVLDGAVGGMTAQGAQDRVDDLQDRTGLVERLETAARRAERLYPASPHVEQQLYGYPFPSVEDEALMAAFHTADWGERVSIAGQFSDARYRQLARRIIFTCEPVVYPADIRERMASAIKTRLADDGSECPWLTVPAAQAELELILRTPCDQEARKRLDTYKAHLATLI